MNMKVKAEHIFKYKISLNSNLDNDENFIYTNFDFMKKYDDIKMPLEESMPRVENDIQQLVFNKEKINKLKLEFCKRIMDCENPFTISCVDWDGGYEVDESNLLENQINFKKRFGSC